MESPDVGPELTQIQGAHNDCMCGEDDIIQPNGRLRRRLVSLCILLADHRRVEERRGGDGVADKAQNVDGGEVKGKAVSGFALPVEDGLRVEGSRPAQRAEAVLDSSHGEFDKPH